MAITHVVFDLDGLLLGEQNAVFIYHAFPFAIHT